MRKCLCLLGKIACRDKDQIIEAGRIGHASTDKLLQHWASNLGVWRIAFALDDAVLTVRIAYDDIVAAVVGASGCLCLLSHRAEKGCTVFLEFKWVILKTAVQITRGAAAVDFLAFVQFALLFDFLTAWSNLNALFAQAADKTNHLKRIFHEDLVRVD